MHLREVIGRCIRRLRERKGLSQRAAAHAIGVSYVHLNRMERGKAEPSLEMVGRIRETLGSDVYLMAWCLHGDVRRLPEGVRAPMRALTKAWKAELTKEGKP